MGLLLRLFDHKQTGGTQARHGTEGRWWGLGWMVVVALCGAEGCTLINELEGAQCQKTADCVSRGPSFSNSICGPEGVCLAAPVIAGGSGGASGEGGAAGGSGSGGQGECTLNADCNVKGGRYLCRDHQCIPLTSKYCSKPIGTESEPDAFVGLLVPLYGDTKAAYGNAYSTAIEAGIQEYITAAKQVGRKPPVFIQCDELQSPDEALDHLLNVVKVKTIIGPSWQQGIEGMLGKITAAGAIALMPLNEDPNLDKEVAKAPGQVWSCRPNRSTITSYWSAAVDEVEKIVKSRSPTIETLNVAMIVSRDASSQSLATQLLDKKTFNAFTRVDYDDYRVTTGPYNALVTGVTGGTTKPNLVIIVSSGDGAEGVIPTLEAGWAASAEGAPRPYYLLLGGRGGINTALSKEVAGSNLASRILSLDAARNADVTKAYKNYLAAYSAASNGGSPRPDTEFFYDCFWLNQYAMYAATEQWTKPESGVTGEDYASKGIARLIDTQGSPDIVGGLGASNLLVRLQSGANVKLTGAASTLDLDLQKGFPVARGSLGCVDPTTTPTPAVVDSGLEFDPATGQVALGTGNSQCK